MASSSSSGASSFASLKQRAAALKAQANTPSGPHAPVEKHDDAESAGKRVKFSADDSASAFESPVATLGSGPPASPATPLPPYIFSKEEDIKKLLSNKKDTLLGIFVECGFCAPADEPKMVVDVMKAHALRLTGTVDALSFDEDTARWSFTSLNITSANPFHAPLATAQASMSE
jgi:hypothetical protein